MLSCWLEVIFFVSTYSSTYIQLFRQQIQDLNDRLDIVQFLLTCNSAVCILHLKKLYKQNGFSWSAYWSSSNNVWVCSVYVGVRVMAQDVLMDPHVHGRPLEEVVKGTHQLPHPRLVGNGKVACKKTREKYINKKSCCD